MCRAALVQVYLYMLPWCGRPWFSGHPSVSPYALGNACLRTSLDITAGWF